MDIFLPIIFIYMAMYLLFIIIRLHETSQYNNEINHHCNIQLFIAKCFICEAYFNHHQQWIL